MDVFVHCGLDGTIRRDHPYALNPLDPRSRYVDFKRWPELIPATLEDFESVKGTEAAAAFFDLVKRVNGPDSILESNDCTFRPPGPNTSPDYPKPFECAGRLMILYRDVLLNQEQRAVALLTRACDIYLRKEEPGLRWGAVRISHDRMRLATLRAHGKDADADQVTLNFWAWGDHAADTLENARRVFTSMSSALAHVSRALVAALGEEEISFASDVQAALEKMTYVISTRARNLPALAASVPPEIVEAARAGLAEASVLSNVGRVPTHARRECDTTLLCGKQARDYGELGRGNAPSLYLDDLNMCAACRSKLRKETMALLEYKGMTLSELKAQRV